MDPRVPEILTSVVGLHPASGQETVLAACSCDDYTLDVLEESIRRVAESVKTSLGDGAEAWQPRLTSRVWSREGLSPCHNLSADTIRMIGSISGSLDFAEQRRNGDDESGCDADPQVPDIEGQSPELVVLFVGNCPDTGKESVIAKAVSQQYSLENQQACVAESIQLAQAELQGATPLWQPQVGVRLSSDRGVLPAMQLSAELVQRMAACEASLDFDPYV